MMRLIKPKMESKPMTEDEAQTCLTVDCILEYANQQERLKTIGNDVRSATRLIADQLRRDMAATANILKAHGINVAHE